MCNLKCVLCVMSLKLFDKEVVKTRIGFFVCLVFSLRLEAKQDKKMLTFSTAFKKSYISTIILSHTVVYLCKS